MMSLKTLFEACSIKTTFRVSKRLPTTLAPLRYLAVRYRTPFRPSPDIPGTQSGRKLLTSHY